MPDREQRAHPEPWAAGEATLVGEEPERAKDAPDDTKASEERGDAGVQVIEGPCPEGLPDDVDGISYVPTLLGKPQPKHDYLYWQFSGKVAVRKGNFKAVIPGKGRRLELYDLDTDPGEQQDMAEKHPDVVARMQRIIEEKSGGAPWRERVKIAEGAESENEKKHE